MNDIQATPPATSSGIERRQHKRYRLVTPMMGAIEHEFHRYSGRVIDISTGGFRLFVPNLIVDTFEIPGSSDFGEVSSDGNAVGGFGHIAFTAQSPHGGTLGFKWDEYVYQDHQARLNQMIEELISQRNAGCVTIAGDQIALRGHVSAALSGDVFSVLEKGMTRITMEECTSIDPGGLDMLIGLQEIGIFVEHCNEDVQSILDRFHLRKVA